MKFKRLTALISAGIITLASIGATAQAATTKYEVPSLYFKTTIPAGYYAFSQDSTIEDGPIAAIYGAPGANFRTLVKHQIMMIDSYTYNPVGEYFFCVAQSDFSTRVQNFYNKSEDYLNREWMLALGDKTYYDYDFVKQKEALFVHFRSEYESDMFECYATVKNGLYYLIARRHSGDYNAATTDSLLAELVDSAHFSSHDVIVRINGEGVEFAQRPMVYKNRTLVPLRAIFEALGATVNWNNETKTVTSQKGDSQISLQINSDKMTVNGAEKTLDAPAVLYNDTTLVPARAVAEAFGYTVDWNENARIVEIKTN